MRAKIPLATLLELEYVGATTGVLPKLDPTTGKPKPDSFDVISAGDRMRLLNHLVDKSLPSMPTAPEDMPAEPLSEEELALEVETNGILNMSEEDLRSLAYGNPTK